MLKRIKIFLIILGLFLVLFFCIVSNRPIVGSFAELLGLYCMVDTWGEYSEFVTKGKCDSCRYSSGLIRFKPNLIRKDFIEKSNKMQFEIYQTVIMSPYNKLTQSEKESALNRLKELRDSKLHCVYEEDLHLHIANAYASDFKGWVDMHREMLYKDKNQMDE